MGPAAAATAGGAEGVGRAVCVLALRVSTCVCWVDGKEWKESLAWSLWRRCLYTGCPLPHPCVHSWKHRAESQHSCSAGLGISISRSTAAASTVLRCFCEAAAAGGARVRCLVAPVYV